MRVKVRIFYPELLRLVDSPGEILVEGGTVGECLHDLARRYPGVEKLIFDARGALFSQLYVFVNAEGMDKAELTKSVRDDDVLIMAVLASGG